MTRAGRPSDPVADRLRIYGNLRSAHLERLRTMAPATMWFTGTRADLDESLVDPANPPVAMTARSALTTLARRPFSVIELNEPAMVPSWKFLVPAVAVVRLRDLLTRRHTVLTSYCIENFDPVAQVVHRWHPPSWLARWVTLVVVRLLVRASDRLAFGTEGSRDLYRELVGERVLSRRSRLFEALPARCDCGDRDVGVAASTEDGATGLSAASEVLFLGSFVDRKGIVPTMAAWDVVHERRPELRLRVIGAGSRRDEVERWARDHPEVTLTIDPPRREIHRTLRERPVLVLLSQPVGAWREQVGLPIVEALAHGGEVVTTSETGLAGWLVDHGHDVVAPDAPPGEVADRILAAVERRGTRDGSLADLPAEDQRLAADEWMMSGQLGA